MPKNKLTHAKPIDSVQKNLLDAVESAGHSREPLRNFLWLLNAHDQLISFPKICRNVRDIFELANTHWGYTEKDFNLDGLLIILDWIISKENEEDFLGKDFIRLPTHANDHPIMRNGSRRHPLYTTLWNTCEKNEYKVKFLLLQAHLFNAYSQTLFKKKNRDNFESYDGEREWKGIENSPYAACLAVRELSKSDYSNLLKNLPVEKKPKEFAQEINNISNIDSKKILERIYSLSIFLKKSEGYKNWITRSHKGGNANGGSKSIKGYIEFNESLSSRVIPIGDSDDSDDDWGELTQITDRSLTQYQSEELFDLDIFPDELESEDLMLSNFKDQRDVGSYAAATASQARHILMANQLFPWTFGLLSIDEVADALAKTSSWVHNVFVKGTKKITDGDLKKLESVCLMRVMLFTASSFERARKIILLDQESQFKDVPLAISSMKYNKIIWKVLAIQPLYKSDIKSVDGKEKKRVDYFAIEDNSNTSYYINVLLNHRTKSNPIAKGATQKANYIFRTQEKDLLSNLKGLLKELDPTGRLTVSKISKFMFSRILRYTKGDVCAASMIAGDEHLLAHVRMYYSVISVSQLQEMYFHESNIVVEYLHNAKEKENNLFEWKPNVQGKDYLGSRLCPQYMDVKNAISELKTKIDKSHEEHDSLAFHNYYTMLTVWRFAFTTACRAIETPYISLSKIDTTSGIGVLSDKDNKTGYKSRLIWLMPNLINLMDEYQSHCVSYIKSKGIELDIQKFPVFFMELDGKDKLRSVAVRPKTMQPYMQPFLDFPANFHRRFMRTELLSQDCSMEAVDCWMGHWHIGEEPWAIHSSFSFS